MHYSVKIQLKLTLKFIYLSIKFIVIDIKQVTFYILNLTVCRYHPSFLDISYGFKFIHFYNNIQWTGWSLRVVNLYHYKIENLTSKFGLHENVLQMFLTIAMRII